MAVKTVQCPDCKRNWTGHFPEQGEPSQGEKTCKDCVSDRVARQRRDIDQQEEERRKKEERL